MAVNDYRCACGEREHHFRAGHPPKVCPDCGENLELIPGLVSIVDDTIHEGEKRSAFIQLCEPGEPPPENRSQLRFLEKRNKVERKTVTGSKRMI